VSSRDKDGISSPHHVDRGCGELISFVWILARGARVLHICCVPICPAVGMGTSVWCCDGGYLSGGGGYGTI
jgi:hypothetical protein